MNKPELIENLVTLGLTHTEASVYVWLVERLQATGYEASKVLKIPRGTAYTHLESLLQKGLIRSSIQNKKRVYIPEAFNVWKKQLEAKSQLTSLILPMLEKMTSLESHSVDVRIYKGIVGLQKAWDEVIEHFEKRGVKICYAVSHGSQIYESMPRYFRRWIERRVANKTQALLIYPLDDKESVVGGAIAEPLAQYKFVPGGTLAFGGDVTCGGNMTAIFSIESAQEPHAVIIESEDITKIISQWFMTLWQILPGDGYRTEKMLK